MNNEAIILAGGLGTRLKHLLDDVPKPMAPVNDLPFLEYIFRYLKAQKIKSVILSVGYKYESIRDHFGDSFLNINIKYSIEDTPLGTGGAIKKAMEFVETESAFILNGDTFFNVDLSEMKKSHIATNSIFSIALKELTNFDRYGLVEIENNIVKSFLEKQPTKSGLINGGTYLLNRDEFLTIDWPEKFSFEKEFLETYFKKWAFTAYISNGYFIDIGIPEDYYKAAIDFKTLF